LNSPSPSGALTAKILFGIAIALALFSSLFLLSRHSLIAPPSSLVRVAHSNPVLEDAIRESRKQLPMFDKRLKNPEPGDRFAIKARFSSPEGPEYLWLKDPVLEKGGFAAVVDQTPIAAPGIHRGDRVHVSEKDVVDWLVRKADGSMAGGATDLALGGAPH
jgi:uncharacterized protein YegJ (DUF2314 family)